MVLSVQEVCPTLHSKLLYKFGQDFLDVQYKGDSNENLIYSPPLKNHHVRALMQHKEVTLQLFDDKDEGSHHELLFITHCLSKNY